MNNSEKKVLAKIKRWLGENCKRYDFWFVGDKLGAAIGWEGGEELIQELEFRNQYSVMPHSSAYDRCVIKNW